jgi:hypothetical protein
MYTLLNKIYNPIFESASVIPFRKTLTAKKGRRREWIKQCLSEFCPSREELQRKRNSTDDFSSTATASREDKPVLEQHCYSLGSSHGQGAELEVRYLLEQLWPVLEQHCYTSKRGLCLKCTGIGSGATMASVGTAPL